MNILWGTCSSNLTHFQLIQQKFVFFMRDIWKSLHAQKIYDLCIKYQIIYYNFLVVQFNFKYLVVVSQKKPVFDTRKIENELFMRRKEKHLKWTLFAMPIRTHVHNMGSFKQTIPWFWSWPSSFLGKIVNILWGTCISNLTHFQLIRKISRSMIK
jgi:hypothetical protein